MSETEPKKRYRKVQHYIVEFLCPMCDTPLEWTGMTLTSYPPQYPHYCPNDDCQWKQQSCGYRTYSGQIVYREPDDES